MGELDQAFVQAPEHRPTAKTSGSFSDGEIPIIDLSLFRNLEGANANANANANAIASAIGEACERWGFFQVINHGVASETRRRLEDTAAEFFGMETAEKRKVKRDEVNPMGYHDEEHTKNVRDWKEVFDFFLQDPTVVPASPSPEETGERMLTNQWPKNPPGFREACQEYAREVEKLAFKLLGLISISLGLPGDRLTSYFKEQTSFLRLNHYPPCPCPELALGVGRHKDGGALTILAQDNVGGLQVSRRSDGQWIPIKPIPDALIINIGNCMQVWTNDKYWSAEHRVVVNPTKERYSMPFFFFPGSKVDVKPLEELLSGQSPPSYKEYNWGKFFVSRNRSDFKKLEADNIQIDHFRVSPPA
ncbi:PREDICTED: protein DMR6-LIKE OXYGENASE 1 [Tarenaya hassleriana]|uniref:protein DMR6-LIKE OXYGENASE 1 n=1 Tax=Tarenaya hassleriana TaxID=28532 RepID=UPI00053C8B1A|nr:PREDICTED: protein DMR6-LIKE OXYGENASE 1 [Tarenaya hassleriana]